MKIRDSIVRAVLQSNMILIFVVLSLFCLSGCVRYQIPIYPTSAIFSVADNLRRNFRLELYSGGKKTILLVVLETGPESLSMLIVSPLGNTLLAHAGALPPKNTELADSHYRPILDLLYQFISPRESNSQRPDRPSNLWQFMAMPNDRFEATNEMLSLKVIIQR